MWLGINVGSYFQEKLGLYLRMVYKPEDWLNRHQFVAEFQLLQALLFYIETNKIIEFDTLNKKAMRNSLVSIFYII